MPEVSIKRNFQIWPKTKLSSVQSTVGGGHFQSIYVAEFGPFNRAFWAWNLKKKNCKIIYRKLGVGGSKTLWNFSEMQSVFETPPIPKVLLFGGYCDYYGVHHPVTRGKPILPPLIVLAPILIILTFPDALMIAMFPRQIIIWISHLSSMMVVTSELKGLSRCCTLLMEFAIKDDDDRYG